MIRGRRLTGKDHALFQFQEPASSTIQKETEQEHWKVLSVEDDKTYQHTLALEINQLTLMGRPVELLLASSAEEAAQRILQHPDIAVVLLDVVMENDNAGLRLVSTIRNVIGNIAIRIILLTGQPGMAPRMDAMEQ